MPKININGKLSFAPDILGRASTDEILKLIKTHDEFEEYFSIVKHSITKLASDEDLFFCNEIWSEISNDRYISKSFDIAKIPSKCPIEPCRYSRYILLNSLIEKCGGAVEFDYWRSLFDFSETELLVFRNAYLKFHERLLELMYGYASGELRIAYSSGIETISRYKALLAEMSIIEKTEVFKYLFEGNSMITSGFDWKRMELDGIAGSIITTRNDESLSERAFVTELLKLFMYHGESNFVSAVYKFTRSNFITKDIERKTIQRCWESMCKVIKINEAERRNYTERRKYAERIG